MSEEPFGLLWLDLETSGLEPETSTILECAYQFTEYRYPYAAAKAGRSVLTIANDDDLLAIMCGASSKVREMHEASGLWKDLAAGRTSRPAGNGLLGFGDEAITVPLLEEELLEMSATWPTERKRKVMLAGCSVHFDLKFLRHYMPRFAERLLSYRVFDVSAAWMFFRSLGMPYERGQGAHRAADDLQESLFLAHRCADWTLNR